MTPRLAYRRMDPPVRQFHIPSPREMAIFCPVCGSKFPRWGNERDGEGKRRSGMCQLNEHIAEAHGGSA